MKTTLQKIPRYMKSLFAFLKFFEKFYYKDFKKYAKRNSASLKEIKTTDNWARLKTINMCV